MPSTLQYPLERHRDLQRRWGRLLRRTAPDKHGAPISASPQPSRPVWQLEPAKTIRARSKS
jgi:hypothetical protein